MSEAALDSAPPTQAALATRAAIVETAERLFRTLGYQKTTVADIARELKMSPANIYRFFPSKSAINEAIAGRILGDLIAAVWQVAHSPASPPDRIRALFRLLQEQTVALFFEERRMHEIVAVALQEHWQVIDTYIAAIDNAFTHIIEQGQAQGVFDTLDAALAGRLVHCTCPLFTHPALVEQCQETKNLPELAAEMAEFCLRALRPGLPSA